VTTLEQALEHERRRHTPLARFRRGCLIAEAVMVSLAGAWEIAQRIRDARVLKKAKT
jgi:hypothetical protein